ncbi:MAG: YggT family protein [Gammaproteobacteria bacterium]|jgi:YggT family protein
MNYVSNAGVFLVQTLFGLYLLVIMLRLLLQIVRADFYNPLSQFLVKVTNPPLKPLRRFIPGVAGIDMASVVLLLVLKIIEILLLGVFPRYPSTELLGLPILAIAELIALMVNVFLFAIIIQAIISWVNPGTYNPVSSLLHQLTDPVLDPFRKIIPPVSGMDLSPLAAIIGIYLLKLLLVQPLLDWGKNMAYPGRAILGL